MHLHAVTVFRGPSYFACISPSASSSAARVVFRWVCARAVVALRVYNWLSDPHPQAMLGKFAESIPSDCTSLLPSSRTVSGDVEVSPCVREIQMRTGSYLKKTKRRSGGPAPQVQSGQMGALQYSSFFVCRQVARDNRGRRRWPPQGDRAVGSSHERVERDRSDLLSCVCASH